MKHNTMLTDTEIVGIYSAAAVAMAVYIGEDFHINAATDPMLSFWDKDRSIIGLPLTEALPELNIRPFLAELREVLQTGRTVIGNEVPAEYRRNGELEVRYYDYEYRPLRNDRQEVYGILNIATDVTQKVANMRESASAVEAANYRLEAMVMNTPFAMAVLTGEELIVDIANQPMLDIWRRGLDQVIGRGLVHIFPELKDQPNPERMRGVLRTGKRFSLPETE